MTLASIHLLLTLTALLISKTGSFAENQPKSLSVKLGNSIQMDINKNSIPPFDELIWTFFSNYSKTIVTYHYETKEIDPDTAYKDRVDFNDQNFSLTLKNMQKNDCGLYGAITIGDRTTHVGEYNVSVVENHGSPTAIFLPWILFPSMLTAMIMI
ncbi:SLAM family member 7-like isoform X2 [Xyrauchen texanus]|uniref:SLAM family member 7-like isoform X2 n=1 Tax=Xyrauchen texanus TaxID=154827 RepID=UPI0022428799|nr:SLAM family member 7-like isoform X2 [Xyrauchen texanus]